MALSSQGALGFPAPGKTFPNARVSASVQGDIAEFPNMASTDTTNPADGRKTICRRAFGALLLRMVIKFLVPLVLMFDSTVPLTRKYLRLVSRTKNGSCWSSADQQSCCQVKRLPPGTILVALRLEKLRY